MNEQTGLFTAEVPVRGHVRSGKVVTPHVAKRRKGKRKRGQPHPLYGTRDEQGRWLNKQGVPQAVPGEEFGPGSSYDLHLPHLVTISMGLGRDSIALMQLLKEGKLVSEGRLLLPKDVDAVIFANTGAE